MGGHQPVNHHCEAHLRIEFCRIREPEIRKYVPGACLNRNALVCSPCHIVPRIRVVPAHVNLLARKRSSLIESHAKLHAERSRNIRADVGT